MLSCDKKYIYSLWALYILIIFFFCFVKLLVIIISGRKVRYLFPFLSLSLLPWCSIAVNPLQTWLQFLSNIYPVLKEGTLREKMLRTSLKKKIVINKTSGDAEIRRHNVLSLPMQSSALLSASRSQKPQPILQWQLAGSLPRLMF